MRQKVNLEECQPAKSRGVNAKGRWRTGRTETKREKEYKLVGEVDEPQKWPLD